MLFEKIKKDLLSLAVQEPANLVLSYSEDPMADAVEGEWGSLAPNFWIVPKQGDTLNLYEWLQPGNWLLYGVATDNDLLVWHYPSPVPHDQVLAEMVRHDILFCIDSFHDNDPWLIFINPAVTPRLEMIG